MRHTRGCVPTARGAALTARLERVESEWCRRKTALVGQTPRFLGNVRIGAPDGFGVSFLAPYLGRLAERHSALKIQLVPVPRAFSLAER